MITVNYQTVLWHVQLRAFAAVGLCAIFSFCFAIFPFVLRLSCSGNSTNEQTQHFLNTLRRYANVINCITAHGNNSITTAVKEYLLSCRHNSIQDFIYNDESVLFFILLLSSFL